jgi:hypothetical protein
MAKYNFKVSTEKEPEVKGSQDTGKHQCEVFGCPRLATIKTSHWNCRYHNLRAGNALDGITLILKNHEREINWYEKVLNMPYHEYELFRGNAPEKMIHLQNEDLIKYRVRMAQYISGLLKEPSRLKIPVTKSYIEFSSETEL